MFSSYLRFDGTAFISPFALLPQTGQVVPFPRVLAALQTAFGSPFGVTRKTWCDFGRMDGLLVNLVPTPARFFPWEIENISWLEIEKEITLSLWLEKNLQDQVQPLIQKIYAKPGFEQWGFGLCTKHSRKLLLPATAWIWVCRFR